MCRFVEEYSCCMSTNFLYSPSIGCELFFLALQADVSARCAFYLLAVLGRRVRVRASPRRNRPVLYVA